MIENQHTMSGCRFTLVLTSILCMIFFWNCGGSGKLATRTIIPENTIRITCNNLSEDATIVASQTDELFFGVVEVGSRKLVTWDSFLISSRGEVHNLNWEPIDSLDYAFILVELDDNLSVNELKYLSTLIDYSGQNIAKARGELIGLLGVDDLLGLQRFYFLDSHTVNIEDYHKTDFYSYQIDFR